MDFHGEGAPAHAQLLERIVHRERQQAQAVEPVASAQIRGAVELANQGHERLFIHTPRLGALRTGDLIFQAPQAIPGDRVVRATRGQRGPHPDVPPAVVLAFQGEAALATDLAGFRGGAEGATDAAIWPHANGRFGPPAEEPSLCTGE